MVDYTEHYLVLTALKQFWHTENKCVFLGDWCFRFGDQSTLNKMEYEVVSNLWDDQTLFDKHYLYCEKLITRLGTALMVTLNRYHGENHPETYWKFILQSWLRKFVNEWYTRYLEITWAIEQYPGINIEILDMEAEQEYGNFFSPYVEGMNEGEYWDWLFLWQYSKILHYLFPQCVRLIEHHVTFVDRREINDSRVHDSGTIKNVGKKAYYKLFGKAPILFVDSGLGKYTNEVRIATLNKALFISLPVQIKNYKLKEINKHERQKLHIELECENEFEEMLLKIIKESIPQYCLESYRDLVQLGIKELRWKPKIVFAPYALNGSNLVCMAHWYEDGVKFRCEAHSSTNTIFIGHDLNETSICDKYYVWGKCINSQYITAPSYKCNYEIEETYTNKKQILWCGSGVGVQCRYIQVDNIHLGYKNRKVRWETIENQKKFAEGLDENIAKQILYRPRDMADFGMVGYLKQAVPNLRIDETLSPGDGVIKTWNLHRRFRESRIIICEVFSSSVFCEALSENIPTLLIEKELYSKYGKWVYDDIPKYIELLKEAGIWYESGAEAAEFLNNNYQNIYSWWFDKRRQDIIAQVMDRLCSPIKDVAGWWKKEINCMLDEIKDGIK